MKIPCFCFAVLFGGTAGALAQPVITKQPIAQSVSLGANPSFQVSATTKTGAISYQWHFRGESIPDATNATCKISGASLENLGTYGVTVSDGSGLVESHEAVLSLFTTVHPQFLPNLSINIDADHVQMSWHGEADVERARTVAGPWTKAAGTFKNSFTETAGPEGGFYRLRNPHPRSVQLFLPSRFRADSKLPLAVLLHGYGRTSDFYEKLYKIQSLAEEKGFLYCHPEGVADHLGLQFWNAWDACCDFDHLETDDVGFLRSLVLSIEAEYHIDPDRVYFIGHSNGAFMALRMAHESSDLVAGIAAISGSMDAASTVPAPAGKVNILQIHGTSDPAVLYQGGKLGLGLPDTPPYAAAAVTTERWAAWNGCTSLQSDSSRTLDLDVGVAGLDTVVSRAQCAPGVSVEHWAIQGAVHDISIQQDFSRKVVEWLLARPKGF